MDISSLLPLLLNLLGGGNNSNTLQNLVKPTPQQMPQIPQNILASYPTSFINNQEVQKTTNQQTPAFSPELINNLMPMLQNLKKTQKNSSPKFSELKSIDEYEFD